MMAKFFILVLTCGVALAFATSSAGARHIHHQHSKHHKRSKVVYLWACDRKLCPEHRHSYRAKRRSPIARSISLVGVTPVLAAKVRHIVAACGSAVISTVPGRGHRSNHPIGRAVDLRGNPSCIYAHLREWPGGYSVDYSAVAHVHISYNPGGQEWGLRFRHGGSGPRMTRYASRLMMRASPQFHATALHRPE
jgi:hypothetical protein